MNELRRSIDARQRIRLGVALAIAVFLVAATVPYAWLIRHFGYDDILREPAATILERFRDGGPALVFAWFAFAMASLLFIPVPLLLARLHQLEGRGGSGVALLGVVSAVVQAIGLLRWVLVVPALAVAFTASTTEASARESVLVVFDTVHRYGGMVVGEMIGQLLLAAWTAVAGLQMWQTRVVPRWLTGAGLATVPLWLVGQSALLHDVVPVVPALPVVPLAFVAWELWLASVAVALGYSAIRNRRG